MQSRQQGVVTYGKISYLGYLNTRSALFYTLVEWCEPHP
jgi:hypothetical protein